MRPIFIAGNWKMNMLTETGASLAKAVADGVGSDTSVKVAVCPPFPFLSQIGSAIEGSAVLLGAQNVYEKNEGAYTGEVSPTMLKDVGCEYVLIGHSERRQVFGETDDLINRKVHAALKAGLKVILCIGETLDQREANETEQVLDGQITKGLERVTAQLLSEMVIAYEPVWAIGTGKTASPEQAQDAHAFVRSRVGQLCGEEAANQLVIQYGGSVKPKNAKELLGKPDVDGALVGGASLKADDFLAIIQAGK